MVPALHRERKAPNVQAFDQEHRESRGDPGLSTLPFIPRIRLWSSPFGNEEVQIGLPPPGLQHRWTDTLVSSDILTQDVPFLAKESLAYWPKGAGLFVSVLTKVTPGKGSVETGPFFILPLVGEIRYWKVGRSI